MEKTTASLIRRFPLTETSLIIHWCSESQGLIKTVAKGARRNKNRFAGKLDLFFRCEIEMVRSRKSDLHILKDLELLNTRSGIRQSYLQTLAAAYFVKLIEKVVESGTPIPDIANLLERALGYLDQNRPDQRAVLHFEKELSRCLGIEHVSRSPAASIANTFGQLPKQREELFDMMRD
ncbi:MAG: DNA repair protein RecO [Verrucomicrobiales bacterium]|nr:DNA repair protein RecO [Verrucomicrobiales bacterium]